MGSQTQTTIKFSHPKDKDMSIELNSSFLFRNGGGGFDDECLVDNIEMITIKSETYTSLKDLIPSSTSPGSIIMAPAFSAQHNSSSWYEYEIPIKNPLVKHAALAYLQPMSTPPEVGRKGLFWKFRDMAGRCCGGCVGWVSDVVSGAVRGTFFWRRDLRAEDDDEEKRKVD